MLLEIKLTLNRRSTLPQILNDYLLDKNGILNFKIPIFLTKQWTDITENIIKLTETPFRWKKKIYILL